ncbi:murein biosynthesis integral membrane protein MurJ [Halochromatium glycolicum]|uniref:Probable lipid II flippase MurJ n=1 Tax=Halochromatium glycolicum TaxID=85075 RepID=A0AAJ0UBG1_9GAMM|nr:murein biosynthesis integral membrane protein MurJ [Halochromatium glycolicum]MBK1707352.1 murein biosynthesis integral membrane protein MurJ [Halochromatium glycolicum]
MASLAASIAKVGSNTLLSRILGFVRDLLVARLFGADAGTDAFFVAFKIPNFMRRLFAEGAFSMAFVPVLNEYKEQRGFGALKTFIDDVAGTLGAVLLVITAVGVLGAPVLVLIFSPGFAADPAKQLLTADMLRLTFPYLLFISLTAFAGGILNTYERFGVPAFTPVLLNLSLIGCALWLAPQMETPIVALAWGVFIAGIAQLLFQLPFLHKLKLLPRPRLNPRDQGVRRIVRLMVPALFGVSVTQINLLIDTLLASFLETGSISWLYYSDRLMEFPLGILGVALGTVILPKLSRQHAAASPEAFSQTLDWALRWVLLLGLPAAVGLFALAGPMIATLFYSGEFTGYDVLMAERSLMAYALGLLAFLGIKVLAPGFYSRQDMQTPVNIAVVAMMINISLNILLMEPLGHAGLALATVIAAAANAALLLRGLSAQGVYRSLPGWGLLLLKGLIASLLMGALLWFASGPTAAWTDWTVIERILRLAGLIAIGALCYVLAALLFGIRPRHLLRMNPQAKPAAT